MAFETLLLYEIEQEFKCQIKFKEFEEKFSTQNHNNLIIQLTKEKGRYHITNTQNG